MEIINPATEAILATLNEDTQQTLANKFDTLTKGQQKWKSRPIGERLQCIQQFQKLLGQQIDALALTLTREVGKPLTQSCNEIQGARSRISYFLEHSEKWLHAEVILRQDDLEERISYEPLGVIANISAWNYPYLVGVNVFVPALIAGNAVMYKPSEFALLTGLKIEELLHQAGVPTDVFQVALGDGQVGAALLELPFNGYFFTGSHKTGQLIYEKVAPKMVPCQLELGGKDPLYVTNDNKDIPQVAAAAVEGAFYNNGQSCCAVERIYVHADVYDEFLSHFLEEVKAMPIGSPEEGGVTIGPLTRKAQLGFLENQIADAVSKGAKVLAGGARVAGKGYFFQPTVLTDVDHTMLVMSEESFGPIIGIQKVANDAVALEKMQDTDYGLTAAVYSDSQERAESILSQVSSGTVYWNCCDRVSPYVPWSGRNKSGIGSTLSYVGIRAFVQPKSWHLRGVSTSEQ